MKETQSLNYLGYSTDPVETEKNILKVSLNCQFYQTSHFQLLIYIMSERQDELASIEGNLKTSFLPVRLV